jgi:2-dehydropantoate 2-reductase
MRTIIYGAGAIGGTVGGHLARAGYEVLLIGRPAHVNAIRQNGLHFVTLGGTYDLRLPAVTGPQEIDWRQDDAVLLCVKGQDTEAAMRQLRAAVQDVPVFCLQNGVRNEEIVGRFFPRVYGVMVRVGGVHLNPGEVIARRDPPGLLVIGRYPSGTDNLAEAVGRQLRTAGFYVLVTAGIMPYKYGKLLGNLSNAIGAITDARGGRDDDYARIAEAARDEARRLLTRAGIRWVPSEALAQEVPGFGDPPRGTVDVPAGSSTWQSLARRQGTVESDFLNGEIVRLAARLGAETPVNAGLARIAADMAARGEPPGKYTAAELRALLGLS